MAKVILLSDTYKQNNKQMKAKDLFNSTFFKKAYKYATLLKPDNIYIVTKKYGIVSDYEIIKPYKNEQEEVINIKNEYLVDRKLNLLQQLIEKVNIIEDEFIFLLKDKHSKLLIPWLNNYIYPFEKLNNKEKINKMNYLLMSETNTNSNSIYNDEGYVI